MQTRLAAFAILAISLVSIGCGGGSSAAPRGAVRLNVLWPSPSRLIPAAAESLVVAVTQGNYAESQLVVRPTDGSSSSEVDFDDVPYGALGLSAKAYPTATGDGVAQAMGTSTFEIDSAAPVYATLSLSSTVAHLAISASTTTIKKGEISNLALAATDSDGNIVLLATDGGVDPVAWSTADATVTLTSSGITAVATGAAKGTATVNAVLTIDDAGHSVTATSALTVKGGSAAVTVQ